MCSMEEPKKCQLDHGGECHGLGPTGKKYHMYSKMVIVPSSPFIQAALGVA